MKKWLFKAFAAFILYTFDIFFVPYYIYLEF